MHLPLLPTIFLSFTLLTTTHAAGGSTGASTSGGAALEGDGVLYSATGRLKVPNNDIICQGTLPKDGKKPTYWSRRRPRSLFHSLKFPETDVQRLCAAGGDSSTPSMGCLCFQGPDLARHVMCPHQYGDTMLLSNNQLRKFCEDSCHCPQKPTAKKQEEVDSDWVDVSGADLEAFGYETVQKSGASGTGSGETVYYDLTSSAIIVDDVPRLRLDPHRPGLVMDDRKITCGAQCTMPQQCGGGNPENGCQCIATQFLRDPAIKKKAPYGVARGLFVGFCSNILSSYAIRAGSGVGMGRPQLGGRSLKEEGQEVLCACNSTYVSGGCCGSSDGLVWEHESMKRGVLVAGGEGE